MKQMNSVIASALVSGLIVLGIVGIGVNAMTNTNGASTSTVAGVQFNSSNSANDRTGRHFERRRAQTAAGTTTDGQNAFTQ